MTAENHFSPIVNFSLLSRNNILIYTNGKPCHSKVINNNSLYFYILVINFNLF